MKCRSKKIVVSDLRLSLPRCSAFTMPEVMAALIILAMVCSSVFVVIDRSMASLADSSLKMQAFETARENMEVLLASDSVAEKTEYGTSDKYPSIQWETTVETFYEPITTRMWIQAVCSAEYIDSQSEVQTVELTHWLTDLSKEQLLALMNRMQEEGFEDQQIVETVEEAAEYAGVDLETIEQWLENGMQTTEDGFFIINELDLYQKTDGNPTPEDRAIFAADYAGVDLGTIEQWLENGMQTTEDGFFITSELNLYRRTGGNPTPADRLAVQQGRMPNGQQSSDGTSRTDGPTDQTGLRDLDDWTTGELLEFIQQNYPGR